MSRTSYVPREKNLQAAVCEYIRLQYPGVLFNSDLSGIRLTMGQAIQAKKLRSEQGFPDIVIYERRGGYNALFIELKRDDARIWLKDNSVSTDPHIREQHRMLTKLNERGYAATFAAGFDEAKAIIDNYLNQQTHVNRVDKNLSQH